MAATTAVTAVAKIAAGTGIHGGDELKVRRKFGLMRSPRDNDFTGFERLSEHFQDPAVEFRQFIQEQHAVMGQGNLAGGGMTAAADQRNGGGGMMRRPDRPAFPDLWREAMF